MASKKTLPGIIVGLTCFIAGLCFSQSPPIQKFLQTLMEQPYLPASNPLIHRDVYTLAYDGRIKSASWVYEKLTANMLEGSTDRSHFDFMEDPLIPNLLRATKEDYKGSGYDRGHLCPAANARANPQSMKETFYLSNISPQHPLLNRKYWLKLEKYVRGLTQTYDRVYAITGPLFLSKIGKDGKRYVQYEVIGENEVAVPTHYFKVLRAIKGLRVDTEAYIIPNAPIQQDRPLQDFRVTSEKVERAAGIFFRQAE